MRLDRILVVDDEPPARRHLIRMVCEIASVSEVLEANDVASAARFVATSPAFDCIFLDVQMPINDGFALFDRCSITAPVIFVTAFHRHAVRAFEVNALDYLLKPVARERLADAVKRLTGQPPISTGRFATDDVVSIRERGRQAFVRIDDIVCIAAADDYTELHLVNGTSRLCGLTMRDWEVRLPDGFVRIHRSTIIGTRHVLELRHGGAGALVTLRGSPLPLRVSRAHLAALKLLLASTV